MRAPCDCFEMFWPSLKSWSALTLSGVRCNLLKQSRVAFFKSKWEIHDGIGRSSRSPVWKHRVAFSRFTLDRHRGQYSAYQLLPSTLTFTDVLIGIDLVRGKMWPSETITFWLSSKSIENRTESGGTYQRNQAFRLTTACGFFEMPWPSLICWSALTLSGVRCKLHKQSRLTFFKSQSEIHDGIGRFSRSPAWKHRVAFSRFTLDLHRGEYSTCQLLPSTLTFSDFLIGIDLVGGSRLTLSKVSRKSMTESGGLPEVQLESTVSFSKFSPDILRAQNGLMLSLALMFSDVLIGKDLLKQNTLDLLQSQSGIAAESYQRNQAQRKILQKSSMRATCGFFEMPWPSLMSWSALTLSGVRCELHKQSRLTFFKSKLEIHDGIGRSSRSPVWKHRVAFSRFTLDRHRGHHSAYQLLSSTLTFTDVLIGIDLVRGKMWPSETITFWLSSKSIENRTESGGTYQRNQAFRLTTACGFFEMPWPSQMSIRTHHVILVDVIWCLIGTDFCQKKEVPL